MKLMTKAIQEQALVDEMFFHKHLRCVSFCVSTSIFVYVLLYIRVVLVYVVKFLFV